MKRLVDETTDELTRSLLAAGIEHRPPPGNKAHVIAALGAGSALGLFSSNAFAWLSTTAGKVTAAGIAVGVAGAVWVGAPYARQALSGSAADGTRAMAQARASADDDVADPALGSGGPTSGGLSEAPANAVVSPAPSEAGQENHAGDARSESAERAASGEVRARREPASDERADDAAPRSARRERSGRKASAKRARARKKLAVSKPSDVGADGLAPAAEAAQAAALEEADHLDSEVRLVDDMHGAARRNDHEALARFLERYRASFPDGQLKKEVAEFAARLERSELAGAR